MGYNLKLGNIKRYLQFKGWAISDYGNLAYKINIILEEETYDIIIPKKETLPDYGFRVQQLIESLSAIEKRNANEIIADIDNIGFDIMQFRFISEKFDYTMPLSNFAVAVDKIKDIIKFEACSELNLASSYTNPYPEARDLVAHCEIAQTAKGSYVVNVLVPLGETYLEMTNETEYLRHLGRRTIARTLTGIKETESLDLTDAEYFKNNYDKKLNKNTCQALKELTDELKEAKLEMNAKWDFSKVSIIAQPSSVRISGSDKDKFAIMENYLVSMPEDERKRIKGKIIDLKRDRENYREQTITIYDENLNRNITIELKENDYRKAIQFYESIAEVELKGVLKMKNNRWSLEEYTEFNIQGILPVES